MNRRAVGRVLCAARRNLRTMGVRRRVFLVLVPVNLLLAVTGDGWSRVGPLFLAVGCVFAFLATRPTKDGTR